MIEINNAPGYFVDEHGDVWSSHYRKGHGFKQLHYILANSGYYEVQLTAVGRTAYVHRLVAEAYIPNPLNLPQVDHINGNKLDNRVQNLAWCTGAQNSSKYRDSIPKAHTQTSGRWGVLYHNTLSIRRFRSLQQAKIWCRDNYHCALQTNGRLNVNYSHRLIFVRDDNPLNVNAFWHQYDQHVSVYKGEHVQRNKKVLGKPCSVLLNGSNELIGCYASISEASKAVNVQFSLRNNYTSNKYHLVFPHI